MWIIPVRRLLGLGLGELFLFAALAQVRIVDHVS
jgi:hypothetical protein